MLVDKLLRASLLIVGGFDPQETIPPQDYDDAIETANMMLAAWATKGVIVHQVTTTEFTLQAGKADYTIGSSADLDTARPNRIVGGFFRLSGIDYPLEVIGRDDYNSISIKTTPGIPKYLYYYPAFPVATVNLYQVPDAAYTMSLDALQPITALSRDTELNLPPEYEEAIKYNLALRMAPIYRSPLRAEVVQLAENSYRALSVQPIPAASFDGVPGKRNFYGAGSINTL